MIEVVIADDDGEARASLMRILGRVEGIRVVGEASDGAAAVALVRDVRPHVVVLDVHMPRMTGVEAARQLRRDGDQTAVVFVTADPEAAEAGLSLADTALLVKSAASVRETIDAIRAAGSTFNRRRRRAQRAARRA